MQVVVPLQNVVFVGRLLLLEKEQTGSGTGENAACHTKDAATALNFQESNQQNVGRSTDRGLFPGLLTVPLLWTLILSHTSLLLLTVPSITSRLEKYVMYSCASYTQCITYTSFQINYLHFATLFISSRNTCGLKSILRKQGGSFRVHNRV